MNIENLKLTLYREAVVAAFTAFVCGSASVLLTLLSLLSPDSAASPLAISLAVATTYLGYLGLKYLPGGSLPWQTSS